MKEVKEITIGEMQYQITAELTIDWRDITWRYDLKQRQKGKRKWNEAIDTDSYTYRNLNMLERRKSELNQMIEKVGIENVQFVRLELWEKLRPTDDILQSPNH